MTSIKSAKTQSSTFTAKYLKPAQYESKLFKIVEYHKRNHLLEKFVKNWEDNELIYLKEKYLEMNNDTLEEKNYYKVKVWFSQFTTDDKKDILYIAKIKYKAVDYKEKVVMNSDNSDF